MRASTRRAVMETLETRRLLAAGFGIGAIGGSASIVQQSLGAFRAGRVLETNGGSGLSSGSSHYTFNVKQPLQMTFELSGLKAEENQVRPRFIDLMDSSSHSDSAWNLMAKGDSNGKRDLSTDDDKIGNQIQKARTTVAPQSMD